MIDDKRPRIVFAPQTNMDRYPIGRVEFLRLVDISSAIITDESIVDDFSPSDSAYVRLALHSGIDVEPDTRVWIVARALERKQKRQ